MSLLRLPKREVEFTLTDELPSNLRNLQSQGNLLAERWASIQDRGLVEYRTKKKYFLHPSLSSEYVSNLTLHCSYNRRYEQKEVEKFPHKEFVKEQIAKYGS